MTARGGGPPLPVVPDGFGFGGLTTGIVGLGAGGGAAGAFSPVLSSKLIRPWRDGSHHQYTSTQIAPSTTSAPIPRPQFSAMSGLPAGASGPRARPSYRSGDRWRRGRRLLARGGIGRVRFVRPDQ